jgi:hypothetical protein
MTGPGADYVRRQRQILLDMHIPDFDEGFLRAFDPAIAVDLYAQAGADSVMFYCNSMTGLCNWPTESGQMHPGLGRHDVVGTTVELLHERGLAAVAYYSVNFNNWAYEEHPDWRLRPANPASSWGKDVNRMAVCCPANTDFHAFCVTQLTELLRYEVDALFLDMAFWPDVCACDTCRRRYADEEGAELPDTIDWLSPAWCRFQATRQRWLTEQYDTLAEAATAVRDVPVYVNSTPMTMGWTYGFSDTLLARQDVVGGDVQERLFPLWSFGHAARRLSPGGAQYMHAASTYVSGAAGVKPIDEQLAHAHVATVFGSTFMAIDGVLPDGSIHAPTYAALREVFDEMAPYEAFVGGVPLTDVAVYWSFDASVDFAANGRSLTSPPAGAPAGPAVASPHTAAVHGACGALQRAHLPVGIITRAELGQLDQFPVVVLPNLLRMTSEEVEAFRSYVEGGGRLYASALTSLTLTDGTRLDDFALADLFGCHHVEPDPGVVTYLRPVGDELMDAIAPTALVPHGRVALAAPEPVASLRVRADRDVEVLATRTQPYNGGHGTRTEGWASIFTNPPWEHTDEPVIVTRRVGAGQTVYSACDIESTAASNEPAERLFVQLVRNLLGGPARVEVDTHPCVWAVPFHDEDDHRIRLGLLNRQLDGPPLPVPSVRVRVTPPAGRRFTALRRIPDGQPIEFHLDDAGHLTSELGELRRFTMVAAEYE